MTIRSFVSPTRIARQVIRSDVAANSPLCTLSSTVHKLPPFMADYERALPARSHRHVISPPCVTRIWMSPASMILRRRSGSALNTCSAMPATPFINAQSQLAELPSRTDGLRSCCAHKKTRRFEIPGGSSSARLLRKHQNAERRTSNADTRRITSRFRRRRREPVP